MRVLGLLLLVWVHPALAFDPAPVVGTRGMVVSAQALASEAGVEVLRRGGNAVDAAVAVGYALAVTYPAAGNLGGGGFMTVRLADGSLHFLDFREKAPLAATAGIFLDEQGNVVPGRSTRTWLAVGVPGSPAGLDHARARWGTMGRRALLEPAIRLAREGFTIGRGDAGLFRVAAAGLAQDPAAAAIFVPGGRALGVGDHLVQTELAASLELLAERGPDEFYRGPIGAAIAAASAAGGGILQRADFEAYRVRELPPIRCSYRGWEIVSAPPPSSGGIAVCQALAILEGFDLAAMGPGSAAATHLVTEAMRRAFFDRNLRVGDPDFVPNPAASLLDRAYAARLRATIDPMRATVSAGMSAVETEGSNTTHYVVADAAGNVVSVTTTLNGWFGVRKVAPGTGILLNNEMDDFTAKPGVANMFGLVQGAANKVAPGKTPLSSMTPTIVLRDGQPAMALGSPGGSRIITTVLNILLNTIDFNMTVTEALDAPRVHHQWRPDVLAMERRALSPDTVAVLRAWGHAIQEQPPWGIAEAVMMGAPRLRPELVQNNAQSLVLTDPDVSGAVLFGAHDPRGGAGAAIGY